MDALVRLCLSCCCCVQLFSFCYVHLMSLFVRVCLVVLVVGFVLFVTLVRGGVRFPGEVDELVLPRLRRTVAL